MACDSHPRLGISACLLGKRVRYDGGDKLDAMLRDEMGKLVAWVPVCPEAECGLGVPREAMRLEATEPGKMGTVPNSTKGGQSPFSPIFQSPFSPIVQSASPRLVTRETNVDLTARMQAWIEKRLNALAREGLAGFVLKARSPSCGLCVEVCDRDGKPCGSGAGLWARALAERFAAMPLAEDEALRDERARAEFLRRLGL